MSDWKSALIAQADEDLASYRVLSEDGRRPGSIVMLGAAAEKIAKAFSAEVAMGRPPEAVHEGATAFLKRLALSRSVVRSAGFRNERDFGEGRRSLVETMAFVEASGPSVAAKRGRGARTMVAAWAGTDINAEYPFILGNDVVAPARYPFDESELQPVRLDRLARVWEAIVRSSG